MTIPPDRQDITRQTERQLGSALHRQAETIDRVPRYRVEPDTWAERTGLRLDRLRQRDVVRGALVMAVVLAIVAGVFSIATLGRRHARPAAPGPTTVQTGPGCVATLPAAFAADFAAGIISGNGQTLSVLSGAADGTVLAAGSTPGRGTQSLELVDSAGRTQVIWTAGPGRDVRAVADPSAAINDSFVVFELLPVGGGPASVVVFNRDVNLLSTLRPGAGYAFSSTGAPAPIVVGDSDLWLVELATVDPARQAIAYFDVQDGEVTPSAQTPVHGVRQLLVVGGDLVSVRQSASGESSLLMANPNYQPSTLTAAARGGIAFTSDRTTLRWVGKTGAGLAVWAWTPGDPRPDVVPLVWDVTPVAIAGPYLVGPPKSGHSSQQLLDTRTGSVLRLDEGITLVRVDDQQAIFARATGTSDSIVSRVPLSTIPPAHC